MKDQLSAPSTGSINRDTVAIEKGGITEQLPVDKELGETGTLAAKAETSYVEEQLGAGNNVESVENDLVKVKGMSPDIARGVLLDTLSPMIAAEVDKGTPPESVRSMLQNDLGYPEDLLEDMFSKETRPYRPPLLADVTEQNTVKDDDLELLTAQARNVHALQMPFFENLVGLKSDRAYKQFNMDLSYSIANTLRKLGKPVEVADNGDLIDATTGKEVDESMLYDIAASENEIIGSIVGSGIALRAVDAIPGFGKFGWLAKKALKLGGLASGGAIGASTGRALDIAYNAVKVKEELNAKKVIAQMKDAGVLSATFDVMGTTAFVIGNAGVKKVGRAFQAVLEGNKEGGFRALKELMNLDNSQIDDIIATWEKSTGEKVTGLTRATRALKVVPLTEPGGELIVGGASSLAANTGFSIARTIDKRAKNLIEDVSRMTNDNIGTVLNDELGKYTQSVKDFYTGIKNMALDATEDSTYAFDYDKLALDPLMEKLNKSLTNEAKRKEFGYLMERIRDIGNVTTAPAETVKIERKFARGGPKTTVVKKDAVVQKSVNNIRSFGDLLDLRRTVNQIKSKVKNMPREDFEAYKAVTTSLDAEIARVAKDEIPNGATWLKTWKQANQEYSNMFTLKENVLYKALTSKGVDPARVVNALKRNITDIDGTFMKVLAKLPERARGQAEGAVLDVMLKKFTLGDAASSQAINFPKLADELKHVGFTSPKAKEMKRAISVFANVFKNDQALSRVSRQLSIDGFANTLTTSPTARAQYAFAATMFNYVKRLVPSQKGRAVALVTNAAKLMENPANSKVMSEVLRELPLNHEATSMIHKMAKEFAQWGEKDISPKVNLYRTGVPGSTFKSKDGPLGKGVYWTTNKSTARARSRVTKGAVIKEPMLPERVATKETVETILGVTNFDMRKFKSNPKLVEALKAQGFEGISVLEEVLMFK